MADMYDMLEPSKGVIYDWVRECTDVAEDILDDHPARVC